MKNLKWLKFIFFSGKEVSLGAAIIARTYLLTGQGHYFALLETLLWKKVSTAGAALGLTTLETVKLFKVSQCQIFLRTLLLLARLGTDLAKLFPNLENETLMDQPLIVPPQLLPVNAGDEFSASMMEIAAASSSSGRLRRRAGSRRPSSGARWWYIYYDEVSVCVFLTKNHHFLKRPVCLSDCTVCPHFLKSRK